MMIMTGAWLLDYNYEYRYRYHRYYFRQICSVNMRRKSRRLSLLPLALPKLKSKMAAIKTESSFNMTSYLCTGPCTRPGIVPELQQSADQGVDISKVL